MANVHPSDGASYGSVGPNESTALRNVNTSSLEEGSGGLNNTQVPEWQSDGYINKRASAQLTKDVKRTRDSILAASVANQAQDPATRKKISSAASGWAIQALAFFLVATFSGVTPFFKKSFMTDVDANGKKTANFIMTTPYMMDYIHSIVIGNIVALIIDGKDGFKACWDLRSILRFSPSLLMASAAESIQMFVLQGFDGTSWRILKQMKLPMTALGVRYILGRKGMNKTQWLLICCVTAAVCGYCLHNLTDQKDNFTLGAMSLAILSLLLTCTAAILGDHLYKTVKHPLHVQIPQGRVASIICSMCMTLFVCWKNNQWSLFLFGGWTWRVWVLAMWLTIKDWTGSFVLKHLDSVWKSLAGVCALIVAYTLDTVFGTRKVEGISISFMVCVAINIMTFAISKREQSEALAAAGGNKKT